MNRRCPICDLAFEEASGEITGGMGISISVVLLLIIVAAGFIGFSSVPLLPAFAVMGVATVLFCIAFYPFSRSLWVGILYLTGDNSRGRLMAVFQRAQYDAIIVGAGPNGLAAAIALASAGKSVLVVEARDTVGGGVVSGELTRPGFIHDIGSAVHPFGVGAPFFRTLPLHRYGLRWVYSPAPLAHPLDDGSAVTLERAIAATAAGLGEDARAYALIMHAIVRNSEKIIPTILGPARFPRHPFALAWFGLWAVQSAAGLARRMFRGVRARALFAGLAAHSVLPLEQPPSAAFGLVLGMLGHAFGWPVPQGGAQKLADALAAHLRALGGEIVTGLRVESLEQLPHARATLFDTTPRQLVQIAGDQLPSSYRNALRRFRHGPGVFKIDYALDAPIPWRAAACRRAITVHVGGALDEIARSEREMWTGLPPEQPYILLSQPTLFDPTRAPPGKHIVWAYCHVPNASAVDMRDRIEAQIERFAPGFRSRISARSVLSPATLEAHNPNWRGGDISGGVQDFAQLFTRPTVSLTPYRTPAQGIYLCSSSTPPGGGVHGMCGYHAAQAVLHDLEGTAR